MPPNLIPFIILTVFLGLIILVGKIASRQVSSSDDYVVANRSAPLFLIVGTIFATFWGGGTVLGGTGAAYEEGIFGVVEDPFAAGLALLILGVFFVSTLRRLNLRSMGELYGFRYGKVAGYLSSTLMIPTFLIWTAVQLLAIGKIINVIFDVNFLFGYLIAMGIIILFTYMGGLIAVAWTDAFQMIIIFIGLFMMISIGFKATGGIENIISTTPENFWNILPRENTFHSWLSYFAMWAGMSLGNLPSPDIAQRAFMARDEKTAKRGMIIAGLMYMTIGFVPVLIALIGINLVSQGIIDGTQLLKDPELLITLMAKNLFGPIGLGIFISSLTATILSSASTSLFATAVLVSNDIYKPLMEKLNFKLTDKHLLIASKFSVILVGIISAIIGLMSTKIYDLMIFAFTLQFGVLFFPFVFALKSKFATPFGVISGMLGGLFVNVYGVVSQQSIIPEPWEFFTLVPPLTNLILILVVSFFTKKISQSVPLDRLYKHESTHAL